MGCVLIVEDDNDVREMMTTFLALEGHEALCAKNGEEALMRMRERRPCVVLLDLHMPVMDGFQFRQRQLAEPSLATVPVVCVTAVFDVGSVATNLGLPCMGKPVDLRELATCIEVICGTSRRADRQKKS